MTNTHKIHRIIKNKLFGIFCILTIVLALGWGMSISATDDIKSANVNFSAIGVISDISSDKMTITQAKASDKSGKTEYNLNIEHVEAMETNTYIPLNFTDIKIGDKIIAQGLTNGNTFFIKRIISFTSIPTPIEPKVATSTATTTEEVVATSSASSTVTEGISSTSPSVESGTSTIESTTTEETATSTTIISTVTQVVENIINTVTETVQNVVDTVTGSTSTPVGE